MNRKERRIRKLFERLPRNTRLSTAEVWEITGGILSPAAEISRLELEGFLTSEWEGTKYPRKRIYWKV